MRMRLVASTGLIVGSTLLLGYSIVASIMAPPVSSSPRDSLVLAAGAAGLALGAMAVRELRELHARWRDAARRVE
jgi:hypothetical protein